MSITPVMESSAMDFRNQQDLSRKDRQLIRHSSMAASQLQNQSRSQASSNHVRGKDEEMSIGKRVAHLIGLMAKNLYFQIFITILTVVTLFLYDIKTISISQSHDDSIGILNCIFFAIFIIEILMNTQTEGYFLSFFFFLDLIATITILLDVDFITDILFNQSGSNFRVSGFIAKSKASRAAARAVRIVKIFRLTRIAKLYKAAQKARQLNSKNKMDIIMKEANRMMVNAKMSAQSSGMNEFQTNNYKNEQTINNEQKQLASFAKHSYPAENDKIKQESLSGGGNIQKDLRFLQNKLKTVQIKGGLQQKLSLQQLQNKESKISKILSQDTIKKIVMIILLIMISIPIVDINNYISISNHWDYMTQFVAAIIINPLIPMHSIHSLIALNVQSFATTSVMAEIICIESPFTELSTCKGLSSFDGLRANDLGVFFNHIDVNYTMSIRPQLTLSSNLLNEQSADSLVVFINYQKYNQIDAGFSMLTTIFICLTIIYLLNAFSNNINDLIVNPIQKMLALVNSNDFREQNADQQEVQSKEYETNLVEKAIVRIKLLMETIFNPLGHNMIQQRFMNSNQSIPINLKHSLKKTLAIFSLCKIKHLSKLCDVLDQDIFGFLNQISMIVHNSAYRYGGFCTKIQDGAFLLTFEIPENQVLMHKIDSQTDPKDIYMSLPSPENSYISIQTDFSLYSAVEAFSKICKDIKIFKYRNDQRLLMAFDGTFNVQMNFALNFGWANEIVTGSIHKLDHQYIGQTIDKLHDMIQITKNYSETILISQSVYFNLNKGMRNYCRGFDCIRFPQKTLAQKIYIVDIQTSNVNWKRRKESKAKSGQDEKTKKQMNMVYLSQNSLSKSAYIPKSFVASKKELLEILKPSFNEQTKKQYNVAFERYLKGDWVECMDLLQNQKLKNDLSAQRIYEFVRKGPKNVASWKGYRQLSTL